MNNQFTHKLNSKPITLLSTLAVMAIFLAACAPAAAPTVIPPVALPTSAPTTVSTVPTIDLASDAKLGKFLVDEKGMALYMFTKDTPDQSNCDAKCLANWPALETSGTPKAGPGVDASLVGTASLAGGAKIVTYNHMPLYYFVKDTQAGQTSGEDVGGVWYVVSPEGDPIKPQVETSPTVTPATVTTEPTLNVASDSNLGEFLVDGKGLTLYIFTKDGRDQSNCDASCLANWPPVLTQGNPIVGPGVDASEVGSARLADGSMIVTYDHRPLYYWIKDVKPGDITGQGVGGVWFMISPSGHEIDDSPQAISDPTPPSVGKFVEPSINVASDPKLGQILVDGKGMTLYIFTKDVPDQSKCDASCLANWPPLLTQGNPALGPGVDDSKIGTALMADGTKIVTYNHMPLYYFIKDTKLGETSGQGVGSVWYVLSPDGEIIGK